MNNVIPAWRVSLTFVRKDFRIVRKYLWIAIPVFLSYGAMFLVATQSYILACGVLSAGCAIAPLWIETEGKSDLLICSLPVSRNQIVAGRYISCLVFMLIGAIVAIVYGLILDQFLDDARFDLRNNVSAIVILVAMTSISFSIFLPFYFSYGLGKGIAAFAMCIVAFTAIAIFTTIVIHVVKTGVFSLSSTRGILRFLNATDTFARTSLGFAVLPLSALAIGAVSARISARIYSLRDF